MASEVQTAQGRIAGEARDGLHVFRGIPYARPPEGALRFRPPQPMEPWSGTRAATEFGPIAPQSPSPMEALFGARERPPMGEDCLSLNVWTPGLDDGRRPVMVWIHGGAFLTGSGSTPWYDGAAFATRGNVVVVTINYRLGALGFLHLREVGGESYAGSGNAGILDQAAALHWVRENIAAFGGDPANVTIFGESAGGMSVGTLLALPAARGLFQRAIPQSGAAHNAFPAEQANANALLFLDALGIGRDDLGALHDLPVDAILAAQARVVEASRPAGLGFAPVVDGDALLERPIDAIAGGSAAGVSLLAGTTLDEMRLFTAFDPAASVKDEAELVQRASALFGSAERAEEALGAYRRTRPESAPSDIWAAVLTDQVFRVPAVRLAEQQGGHAEQTWMYLFTWATPVFDGRLGSCHALEIPFVFNTLEAPGAGMLTGAVTPEMRSLAEGMQDAWIAFARSGDPNHPGMPAWEHYEPDRRATMLLGAACTSVDDPYGDELHAWDGVL